MVEPPGGRSLCFPVCVGIDIHGGSYIGVAQKLLHILGCCTIGQQIGCEGMSEQMEVKLSKVRHYPDVQAFTATYRKAEKIVSQYNRDLAQWEQTVQEKKRPAEKPPEKQSVRDQLRRLQEEGRKKSRNRNRDHER